MDSFVLNGDGSIKNVFLGIRIEKAIHDAILLSKANGGKGYTFEFNDVYVTVDAQSMAVLIIRDWERAVAGYIDPHIGPHPKDVLSPKEMANDRKMAAKRDRLRRVKQDLK